MLNTVITGIPLESLSTPALLLDLDKLEHNLDRMTDYIKDRDCDLRPHIKGHKNVTIAQMQIERGAIGVTCAKTTEAEVMINGGIKNILIANQVVDENKIELLAEMANQANIMVAVDNLKNCHDLAKIAQKHGTTLGILVEIDVGLGRCGVKNYQDGVELVKEIMQYNHLDFKGIMAYEGPFRGQRTEEKAPAVRDSLAGAIKLKELINQEGIDVDIVSCGSTGTWNITGEYPGITEIQAGTYPLMETAYLNDGIPFQPALFVLASVISKSNDKLVLDAGLKAMTDDQGIPELADFTAPIISINEEHSAVKLTEETDKLQIGDRVRIIPAHSCTTVNLYDHYCCVRENIVTTTWKVHARGKLF